MPLPGICKGRRRRSLAALALAALALLAAIGTACGSPSTDSDETPVATPSAEDIIPILVSHELAVGENRFVLGLQDRDNNLILNAGVHLRFFSLKDGEAALQSESDTFPVTVQESSVHEHEDGTPHLHAGDEVGVYVTYVKFDEAGLWGVEVNATVEGRAREPTRVQFDVLEKASTPAVGDPAPRTVQQTLRDVTDISEIDSSSPPRPAMHQMTIAEAIDSGRPTVVAFATPAFCQSRVCGPLMDTVVDPLLQRYGDRVNFVHVEPYVLEKARQGQLVPVPAAMEWGLQTEPWLFIIDPNGKVADKFEAIVAVDEVEPVLDQVLGEPTGEG
jgi:hypothetical protein